ncbi:MAG TPA: hypothetical protein VME20_03085 [Acidimicrobiales bacterium]|nr:hypothetical protein [Acidimicrobiales bacterium]HUB70990.1 hypothetical protein [Acidimicrobiales bacterium]
MRVAVAGGTGTAGSYALMSAKANGHETVPISRATGVDLVTGSGLEAALEGVDVIIDAAGLRTWDRRKAEAFFTTSARRLQEVGSQKGARMLVLLSIVGIDRAPLGYYKAKLAHEAATLEGPLPVAIVRATQFYELAAQVLSRTRFGPVALMPRMRSQPVAARTVGEVLVEVATATREAGHVELAGPEQHYMPDVAQYVMRRSGKRTVVFPFSIRGEAGRALQGGALLPGPAARIAGPTLDDWLESEDSLYP